MKKPEKRLSQAMEDYLETIYVLSKNKGYARTGEIAKYLNVSPSSVVEMIGKISKLGLAEWKRYEGVFLTPDGRMRGEVIHIRHETLRRFFEFIGVAPDIANKEACIIEHELSPVTTSALGNLVNFLQTPAGSQTISALQLYLKFQDVGLPWEDMALQQNKPFSEEVVMHSVKKSQANHEILSAITRHDLLNTITALNGYLDLLKGLSQDENMNMVVSRIESVILSMSRQITSSSDHLIPGSSGNVWLNLGLLTDSATDMLKPDPVIVEHDLDCIEIYADPLIEKVVFNLIDNSLKHGGDVHHITCGYSSSGTDLIWHIQDDGTGIPPDEKQAIFRATKGENSGMGLYLVDQILNACGMQIEERGIPGKGARFDIFIPEGLYRIGNNARTKVPYPGYSEKSLNPGNDLVPLQPSPDISFT